MEPMLVIFTLVNNLFIFNFVVIGAKVVMANRNMELSEKVAQKLRTEISGCQIRIVELNLASLKSVKRCANELIRTEIKIHLLINNAGNYCVSLIIEVE